MQSNRPSQTQTERIRAKKDKDGPHRKKVGGKLQKGSRQMTKRYYHFTKKDEPFLQHGSDTHKHQYISLLHIAQMYTLEILA